MDAMEAFFKNTKIDQPKKLQNENHNQIQKTTEKRLSSIRCLICQKSDLYEKLERIYKDYRTIQDYTLPTNQQCNKCGKIYKTTNIFMYLKSTNENLKRTCAICNKGFLKVKEHIQKLNVIKNHKCHTCEDSFSDVGAPPECPQPRPRILDGISHVKGGCKRYALLVLSTPNETYSVALPYCSHCSIPMCPDLPRKKNSGSGFSRMDSI